MANGKLEKLDELLRELQADPSHSHLASSIKEFFSELAGNADPLGLNMDSCEEGFAFAGRLMEMGVMTAAFFHEINQPLLGIKGFAELIRDRSKKPQESKVKEWALEIRRQVDKVLQMQSRISAQMKPNDDDSPSASLQQCVDEAIGLFEHRLVKKRVSIYLDLPGDLPELQIPSMHLVQILVNLVANALDALDQVKDLEGRKLGIVLDRKSGPLTKILIADTGPGISPEQLPRLFVPFSTTKGERGSGLGLVISKKLAQNADGDLTLLPASDEAHKGWKGAVFQLQLASADQGEKTDHEHSPPRAEKFKTDTSKRLAQLELDLLRFSRKLEISRRVLLADGNSSEQMELIETLAQHSILADVVSSAEEALERLTERQYAVLITDMQLPDLSCVELVTRAHKIVPTVEVLVCTDSQSIDTVIDALDRGASDYIPRPYPSRPFLSWKVKGALARYEFETRTNEIIRFLGESCEQLAIDSGKDVQAFCTIPLKRALDSYRNSKDDTRVGILGNKVLARAAASLGYDMLQVDDASTAMDQIREGKIQVLVLVEDQELDAVDLIYQVRQMDTKVGLFVIAQENRLDDLVQSIGTGVGDYLLRPLEGRELFPSKLRKLISRHNKNLRYSRLLSELKTLNLDLQKAFD